MVQQENFSSYFDLALEYVMEYAIIRLTPPKKSQSGQIRQILNGTVTFLKFSNDMISEICYFFASFLP